MPTTHVEPGSESLLQEIAATLWKSRKVVVITGAGISTNSGIPDFRSENGLYSLIQAQFDAAAAKGSISSNGDADESDLSSDYVTERPAKRRRISPEETGAVFPKLFPDRRLVDKPQIREQSSSEKGEETQGGTIEVVTPEFLVEAVPSSPPSFEAGRGQVDVQHAQQNIVAEDTDGQEHAPGPPQPPIAGLEDLPCAGKGVPATSRPTLTPLLSPRPSSGNSDMDEVDRVQVTLAQKSHFVSSPPSFTLGVGHNPSDLEPTHTIISSPLSSPPPYLSDPFQEYPGSSSSPSLQSSQEDGLSGSQSGASTPSTPLLTSQTSFASTSSRASLTSIKGKDLFDAQIWSCPIRTSVFYTFATTLRQKVRTAEPTSSHRFVSVLRDTRKLVRCYTQNIDQLEERVGLTTSLELGPGSRYRFSARAGRNSGGPTKTAAKEAESTCENPTQPERQLDGVAQEIGNEGDGPQAEEAQSQGDDPDPTVSVDPSPELPIGGSTAMTSTLPNTSPALGPNRGVECVFLHGSLAQLRCFVCGRAAPWDDETRLMDTMAGRQPSCPHCAGATAARQERGKRALGVGKLRPDIVLYGEEHPHAHLISPIVQHDLSLGPDMLLILGTSMRVHGLKVLVKEFAKAVHDRGGKVVFVNFTKPPDSVWADVIDFWIQWDCDAWVQDLRERKPALFLAPGTALPEAEKAKPGKSSRKSNETAKRGSGAKGVSSKQKWSGEPAKVPPAETDDTHTTEGATNSITEMPEGKATTQSPNNKAFKPRRAKVRREPRYNPNAKRPSSVRDDKFNGAYLVKKIGLELRRIAGTLAAPRASSPQAASQVKPKAKRARKSGPVTLQSLKGPVLQKDPPGEAVAVQGTSPQASVKDDSISAAVKSRKRKRTVTWKKIHGVETPVALEDGKTTTSTPPLPGPARLLSLGRAKSPEPFAVRLPRLENPAQSSPDKLQPLEPPALMRFSNPFFLSDPLCRHFGYPSTPRRLPRDEGILWSPTMQLRREEQEAASALSSMSGRFK